jgi:hypothetical protein
VGCYLIFRPIYINCNCILTPQYSHWPLVDCVGLHLNWNLPDFFFKNDRQYINSYKAGLSCLSTHFICSTYNIHVQLVLVAEEPSDRSWLMFLYVWDLSCFGILRSLEWYCRTDVSGQPVGPIFKGQTVFLYCLALEDGTNKMFRNVGTELPLYGKVHAAPSQHQAVSSQFELEHGHQHA